MLAVQQAFRDNTLNRKLVSVTRHPELELWILNYTPACQYAGAWDEITTACRGLILDGRGGIIARPFAKFFNLGERPETQLHNLPALPFTVFEKVDGSLGILYRGPDRRLRVATRGNFVSTQALWVTAWLETLQDEQQALLHALMDEGLTPLVEIVFGGIEGPVICYDWEGLVLLALVENETGRDRKWGEVVHAANRAAFRLPAVYTFGTLEEVIVQRPVLPPTMEGFVVRYVNGFRVKVKGEQYAELFRAVNHFSAQVVLEAMRGGREDFFVTLPEELRPLADATRTQIAAQIAMVQERAKRLFAAAPRATRKDFALWVKANAPPELQGVLFTLLDAREPDWYRLVDVSQLG